MVYFFPCIVYNEYMTIESIEKNFVKRGFRFQFFETTEEAISYILSIVPEGSSIGFGGSMTVQESGLLEKMQEKNYDLYHRALRTDIEPLEMYKKMYFCDWYISSANALTEQGEIINIDGRGNRVSAILDGPKKVIFLCGINKISPDTQSGIDRVRNVASPLNCVRLQKNTPCRVTGKCSYCNSSDTICKATVILHHPTTGTEMYVVLVNQSLGY